MEHTADQAAAPELPDEPQAELVPEAEALDQHPEDAHQPEPYAWDAWDVVHPDAADAADHRPASSDAGAGKLAVPAPDAPAQDAWSPRAMKSETWTQRAQPDAAAELCTLDAVQSAEQSCGAPEVGADPQLLADAAQAPEAGSRQTRKLSERPAMPEAQQQRLEVA